MKNSELVFIPSPLIGHIVSTVELAKILINRDQRLSITIIVMKHPFQTSTTNATQTTNSTPRLRFIDLPHDESTAGLIRPHTFLKDFVEYHKPHVRDIARSIIESDSVSLAGFVVDMFCVAMTDIANEFGAPTYLYFTAGAAFLGLMLYLQALRDEEGHDVTELKDSGTELSVPCYVNPVPDRVLPAVMLNKEGGSTTFLDLPLRFREAKGIMVNTFEDLELHAVKSFSKSFTNIPPIFPVGPILDLKDKSDKAKSDEIIKWLDDQSENSVVFLCFGSMGSFVEEQAREIAVAIERSGHRFLWSLRRPPAKDTGKFFPEEYENYEEVLPKGFLERTSGLGKIIGWAPQLAVLSHPSVGGFVSHCGWNSTLESIWFGVPIATWPIYAEQQLNAFQMVKELGLAVEIKMDYMKVSGVEIPGRFVTAEEIENGIKSLMMDYENGESEIRKKVKEMKEKSRLAVSEGGSSYNYIGRFIDHVIDNMP